MLRWGSGRSTRRRYGPEGRIPAGPVANTAWRLVLALTAAVGGLLTVALVAVPARAQGQLPHQEEAPPFADDVQGSGDGACLLVVLHGSHGKVYFCKCQLH